MPMCIRASGKEKATEVSEDESRIEHVTGDRARVCDGWIME